MAAVKYLIDTSAMTRVATSDAVAIRIEPLLEGGHAWTCAILNLEALFSATSPQDYVEISRFRNGTMLPADTDEWCMDRAQEVQALLAERAEWRSVSVPDLIVAAVAERHGLTVLHYDHDYDFVAAVTGQPVEWVVPKGTADRTLPTGGTTGPHP